jgi:hypothetical protein
MLVKRIALGLAIAAVAAPSAAAQFPPSDARADLLAPSLDQDAAYLNALEIRSEALNRMYGPDGLDRFVANNPDGIVSPQAVDKPVAAYWPTPTEPVSAIGGAPASVTTPVSAIGGPPESVIGSRPELPQPTGRTTAPTPVSLPTVTPAGSGFDFGDAAVGFGIAAGLALLAGGAALMLRQGGRVAPGH